MTEAATLKPIEAKFRPFAELKRAGGSRCLNCGVNMLWQKNAEDDRYYHADHMEHTCAVCGQRHDVQYANTGEIITPLGR